MRLSYHKPCDSLGPRPSHHPTGTRSGNLPGRPIHRAFITGAPGINTSNYYRRRTNSIILRKKTSTKTDRTTENSSIHVAGNSAKIPTNHFARKRKNTWPKPPRTYILDTVFPTDPQESPRLLWNSETNFKN